MFARPFLIVLTGLLAIGLGEAAFAQTGACCIGGGCVIDTQANCTGGGGVYAGDNTDCAGSGAGGGTDCNANGVIDTCDIVNCTPGDPACDDCNGNGIPDACEIQDNSSAPNGPYFCTSGCDPDCNNNGIPDACDISSGSSQDLDMNGVPDECISWTGAGDGTHWHDPGNWTPMTVPNNTGPETFSVVIDTDLTGADINIVLDLPATIDTMKLLDTDPPAGNPTASLALSGGNLTIATVNGIIDEGLITIDNARSLVAAASFKITGSGKITLGGATASISPSPPGPGNVVNSFVTIDGQGVIDADFTNSSFNTVDANVPGGTIEINGTNVNNNGLMSGTSGGTLDINTNISETPGAGSTFMASGGNVDVGDDMDDPRTVDGCGPIESVPGSVASFTVSKSSLLGFSRWTIGTDQPPVPGVLESTLTVRNLSTGLVTGPIEVNRNGTLIVDRSTAVATNAIIVDTGRWQVGGTAPVSEVTLSGPYSFTGTDETLITWGAGSILRMQGGQFTCNPPGASVTIEAGSTDLGPAGGPNNFNLATLEISAAANVMLVDDLDNGNRGGPAGFSEAVYADSLIMGAGSVLQLNGLNLYVGGAQVLPGPFGDGTVIDLEACCFTNVGCVMLDPLCCTAQGGTPLGAGTVCAPPEACCVPVKFCFDGDPNCCALQGGIPLGPGSACQGDGNGNGIDDACETTAPVPAVSSAGRWLLLLLIVVAGVLALRRGRPAAVRHG